MVRPEKIPVFFDDETGETIYAEVIDSRHSENGTNTTTSSEYTPSEEIPDVDEAMAVGIENPEELARVCDVPLWRIQEWLQEWQQQQTQRFTKVQRIPHNKSTTPETATHSDSDDGYPSSESSVKSEDSTSSELASSLRTLDLECFHVLDSFFVKFPNPAAEDVEHMAAALNISPNVVYEFNRMQKREKVTQQRSTTTSTPCEPTGPPPLKKCKVDDQEQFLPPTFYQESARSPIEISKGPDSWMTVDALQLILADKEQEVSRLLKENEGLRDSKSKDDKIRILERKLKTSRGLEDKCEDLERELRDCRRRLQNLESLQNLEDQLEKSQKNLEALEWRCEQQERKIERLTHSLEAEQVLDSDHDVTSSDSRLVKKLAVKEQKIESLLNWIQDELQPKIKNQESEIADYDETMKKMNVWRVEDRKRIQMLTMENQGFRSTTQMLVERNLEFQNQHREISEERERRIWELKEMIRELTE